ncbi:MAG: hypothetical protein Kow0079_16620 [Vicingaceae bacterium]
MKISRKAYNIMLNCSIIGLGLSFVYYGFIIEKYPYFKIFFDLIGYVSFTIFIFSIILKSLKRVNE